MQIDVIYSECPHCKTLYSNLEFVSYTLRNAQSWSDGKIIDSEWSEYSQFPFTKCSNCGNFFWFSDCRKVRQYELLNAEYSEKAEIKEFMQSHQELMNDTEQIRSNYYPFLVNADDFVVNLIADFQEIIKKTQLNAKRELFVRIKLWQQINDLIRDRKCLIIQHVKSVDSIQSFFNFSIFRKIKTERKNRRKLYFSYKVLKKENLLVLKELIEPIDIEDKLLLIEVYRALGDFSKSKTLLGKLDPDSLQTHSVFVQKSKFRLHLKLSGVFKL